MKAVDGEKTPVALAKAVKRGEALQKLQRTTWLTMVFWLHVLAAGAAAMVWWMEKRGPGKPDPVLELKW